MKLSQSQEGKSFRLTISLDLLETFIMYEGAKSLRNSSSFVPELSFFTTLHNALERQLNLPSNDKEQRPKPSRTPKVINDRRN